jgi:hypothetical protein
MMEQMGFELGQHRSGKLASSRYRSANSFISSG